MTTVSSSHPIHVFFALGRGCVSLALQAGTTGKAQCDAEISSLGGKWSASTTLSARPPPWRGQLSVIGTGFVVCLPPSQLRNSKTNSSTRHLVFFLPTITPHHFLVLQHHVILLCPHPRCRPRHRHVCPVSTSPFAIAVSVSLTPASFIRPYPPASFTFPLFRLSPRIGLYTPSSSARLRPRSLRPATGSPASRSRRRWSRSLRTRRSTPSSSAPSRRRTSISPRSVPSEVFHRRLRDLMQAPELTTPNPGDAEQRALKAGKHGSFLFSWG